MFIRELQLDGYGALQGKKLVFEEPLTVLYGPNEAGKSTLLRFTRSMLYGFPTRKDPVERGEPVSGGKHGGRMLLTQDGREWLIERYADRGSGLLVRDGSGAERQMSQAEWERVVLGGISERLFRQLFAVSLDELHELRTLQGDEIGNYLYHAGLAGGAALTSAKRRIAGEMDRLYRPRGSTQEVNRLLAEIKELETTIRQSRNGVQAYNETEALLQEADGHIAGLDRRLPALRLDVAKLQGALKQREWWLKRQALLAEEAELRGQLPDPSAPLLTEEAAAVWAACKTRRTETAAKLDNANRVLAELRSARESMAWEEALVNSLPQWEQLESRREGISARREELKELEAERRMLEETVQGLIARIASGWGEEQLLAFGGSAAEREEVRRQQMAWEQAQRESEGLLAEARRLGREQETVRAEMAEAGAADNTMARIGNVYPGMTDPGQGLDHSPREESALTESALDSSGPHGSTLDEAVPKESPLNGSELKRSAHEGTPASQRLSPSRFVPRTRAALLQAWHGLEDEYLAYERAAAAVRSARLLLGAGSPSYQEDSRSRRARVPQRRHQLGGIYALAGLFVLIALTIPFLFSDGTTLHPAAYLVSFLLLLVSAGLVFFGVKNRPDTRGESGSAAAGQSQYADAAASERLYRRQVSERLRQLVADDEAEARRLLANEPSDEPISGAEGAPEAARFWTQLREAVHSELERLEAQESSNTRHQEKEGRLKELLHQREALERDLHLLNGRMNHQQEVWQRWLSQRELPAQLTPDSLPELFSLAEQGRTSLRQRKRVSERIEALSGVIDEFEREAGRLLDRTPPSAAWHGDPAQAVQMMYREAVRQQAIRKEAAALERQIAAAEADAAELAGRMDLVAEEIKARMQEAGDRTEERLEQRLLIDEKCRELRRELREIVLRLEAGRDADGVKELLELLERQDESSLAAGLLEQQELLAAAEQQRTEQLDRRGRLAQELERLRKEAELEQRRQRLGELQAKLEQLLERYAVLALADQLMNRTKAVFEEERQPEVLQRASGYFRRMTNGAYIRIVAPGDSATLRAETGDRRQIDSPFLSRGTQEQLYLAMRFALCDAASAERPLPLLLDDLFVHFDEQRLKHTIPVLADIAKKRQILLFTCHRHVAETIAAGMAAARILTLEGRSAAVPAAN